MKNKCFLGVLGGLGPLVSAKFVENFYLSQLQSADKEQGTSQILLYSDPKMPDRTASLYNNKADFLLDYFINSLEELVKMGADNLVVCCFTLHYLLNRLPQHLSSKIISLVDIALQEVKQRNKKTLLLCTKATNTFQVFEKSLLWNEVKHLVVKLDDSDQEKVHKMIYQLKICRGYIETKNLVQELLQKYEVSCWIAGCTEFHLLNSVYGEEMTIDPLFLIIKKLIVEHSLIV